MGEVNIETIMAEIRREIREEGYRDDLPSFDETENGNQIDQSYSEAVYLTLLQEMDEKSDIVWYRDLDGGALPRFLKKAIRKLTSFLGVPVVVDQSQFNRTLVHEFAQLSGYIREQEEVINQCRQRITLLEDTVDRLRSDEFKPADQEKTE